jgi:CRISPR system Cascade subunit CasB
LVEQLTEFAHLDNPNREVLAHLRRGLDHPLDYTLGRVGWLFRGVPDGALENAALAAGLFAWVKGDISQASKVTFGAAFGAGLTLEEKQQREKRFIDLLDTDAKELPYKLRQAITLIARECPGLDWVALIQHLCHWAHPDRWVQRKWARDFWGAQEVETTANQEQTVSE